MNPTQTNSHLTTDCPTLTVKGDSSRCQHRYFTLAALPLREHDPRRRAPNRDQSLTVRRPALDNRCPATHDATQFLLPAE